NFLRPVTKPMAIEQYTQKMGGVDRADKKIANYLNQHRSLKWWKKVFFYFIEVSFSNSLIIWKAIHGQRACAVDFRIAIANGLLEEWECQRKRVGRPVSASDTHVRLTG